MTDETSDQNELPTWRRVRRYAVPAPMIARATARRLAGDWRGACAAANVDVVFDAAKLADTYGAEAAARLADELAGFAPDLLRWHLPRALGGRTSLATGEQFALAPMVERVEAQLPRLVVLLPKTVDGSQRLRLDVRTAAREELPGYLWDAREAHGLRAAWGGADRMPFLAADGTPLAAADLGVGTGAAARAERAAALLAAGDVVGAWREAGIDLDPADAKGRWGVTMTVRSLPALNLAGLLPQARALAARHNVTAVQVNFGWRIHVELDLSDDAEWPGADEDRRSGPDGGGVVRARLTNDRDTTAAELAEPLHRLPVDLELLRHGLITVADLHPLVRAALVPGADAPQPDDEPEVPRFEPVAVRCRGAWHRVHNDAGRLQVLDHTPEEVLREQMMRSLGGQTAGCFAAEQAWRSGAGRLPRRLRAQRDDLMQRVLHGDTDGLLALLDRGMDPQVRDGRGFTLLHHLRCLDHERVLPRLLAAGLPVDARDHKGRTPLHVAVGWVGTSALVKALLEAGADPKADDADGVSPTLLLEYKGGDMFDDEDEDWFDGQQDLRLVKRYLEEAAER
ncbi:ankyrin repeat domain-containing protein [Catellatospora tritici]|uniref:ankyrin repeat domain-containing protein n=1 Tax=Catellatospora tritici TaxID=2851566 RepID=UPI001C2CFD28|nr:ankyrin repeat domain-containing protein [Catellatospora tritici]MBV1850203.1 ankyrin repeat domain-containing protein [Catellatospora tritici]